MTRTPIPLSLELIRHHEDLHPCRAGTVGVECPCGDCLAMMCPSCDQPLFVACKRGTWCQHARELWSAYR